MDAEPRANFIGGVFAPASRGGRFQVPARRPEESWPQSGAEDVAEAARVAAEAGPAWRALTRASRAELVCALARELERDPMLSARVGERFGLAADELAPHFHGLSRDVRALLERPPAPQEGVAWHASDWRELVRAPLADLARELASGRTAVLVSDARLPEVAERVAVAARAAGLPPGVLGLLHGATRELVALALGGARGSATLVASGLVERMVDLRRLCETLGLADPRLRALRCGVAEIGAAEIGPDAADDLDERAREVVERAFGRGSTLTGQLPGALGRVFCSARLFSEFTERLLAALEESPAARAPVPQVDSEASARVRTAWELGLDEGATCIAGGGTDAAGSLFPPTVFTNVEPFMAAARRQDPLPVLCLLRAP